MTYLGLCVAVVQTLRGALGAQKRYPISTKSPSTRGKRQNSKKWFHNGIYSGNWKLDVDFSSTFRKANFYFCCRVMTPDSNSTLVLMWEGRSHGNRKDETSRHSLLMYIWSPKVNKVRTCVLSSICPLSNLWTAKCAMLAVNEKEINLKAPVTIPGIDVTTLYCVIACAANLCLLSRVSASGREVGLFGWCGVHSCTVNDLPVGTPCWVGTRRCGLRRTELIFQDIWDEMNDRQPNSYLLISDMVWFQVFWCSDLNLKNWMKCCDG
jgi:hypothetical protein